MKSTLFLLVIFAVSVFTACSASSAETQTSAIKQISVEQAKRETEKSAVQFIDVRTEAEYDAGHAAKTVNLPLDSLEQNLSKIDKSKPVYIICQTGRRSQKAAELLEKNNFKDLYNIEGGTAAWEKAGLPIEK